MTTDGSGGVSAWSDQSAAHNDLTQATASFRPQLVSNAVNGLPVLRFDGAGDFMSFAARLTTIRSAFWVVKGEAASTGRFLLGDNAVYDFHPAPPIFNPNYSSPNVRAGQTWLNGSPIDATNTVAPTSMAVLSLITTGNVTADNFSRDRNSAYWEGSWWGDLAELIVYTRALSAAERSAVEAYLLAKYQIGSVVTPPAISPAGGLFTDSVAVTASTATPDAEIRYTVDGSEPTGSSPVYTEPLTLTETTTLKAKAFHDGLADSSTTTARFTNSLEANPASVSGLKLWLRADAGVPSGWGDYWADQSGQGNHAMQPFGVALPRLVQNAVNGLPVLRFDGTDDFVNFTNRLTTIRTVFWVVNKDPAAPSAYRFLLGDPSVYHFHSSETTIWHSSYTSSAVRDGQTFVNGAAVDGTLTAVPTTPAVVSLVTTETVSAGSFSLDRNGSTATKTWWGDLAELLIYDRALTTSERESIEAYLQLKYALGSGLPTPIISPGTGTFSSVLNVTISSAEGTTIRYTTNGLDPTATSTLYSGAVSVSQSLTLKAKAFRGSSDESAVSMAAYTMKVASPVLGVAGGDYDAPQTVTVTSATAGADIHYTITGAAPTQADPVVSSGSSIAISTLTTLKVAAWKTGWTTSDLVTAAYAFYVATPALVPGAGSYSGTVPVTVSTVTPGATLNYRLDGGVPTGTDPVIASGSAVSIDRSATLKVVGSRTGWVPSGTVTATYKIWRGTVITPVLSPPPGTFSSEQLVTISSATGDATIRYTVDGTEPTFRSPIYSAPVLLRLTAHVRAKAFSGDMTPGGVVGGLYVIDLGTVDPPRFSPGSGVYPTYQDVQVISETTGATIHYTTDGAEPTETDAVIASGSTVRIGASMVLRAKAWKTGLPTSLARWASYELTGAVTTGSNHTVALKVDGTLWSWGSNAYGNLGDPSVAIGTSRTTPGPVAGLTDVVAVSCGSDFCLALKRNRTVWSWGRHGGLGDGSWCGYPYFCGFPDVRQVINVTDVVAISAGDGKGAALESDGSL